jgi:hypothetical protein
MKLPSFRKIIVTLSKFAVALFALFYLLGVFMNLRPPDPAEDAPLDASRLNTIALFGASGTAGDGILKAAMADPNVEKIHVVTRRPTPRIEEGMASGKVKMTLHRDYLDYSALHDVLAQVRTVYWAIGISSIGANQETYKLIHVDFPAQFIEEWLSVASGDDMSFQFISSSDISENSDTMWVREKIRAEKTLFALAAGTGLRVIAHRPDYIKPAKGEAHIGQNLLYWFFRPVGAAVRSTDIGRAMLEITIRGSQFENGSKLSTRSIHRYSNAYLERTEQQPAD